MMYATEQDTLADLADLLAADAWVIYEYKVLGHDAVSLVLKRDLSPSEGENEKSEIS